MRKIFQLLCLLTGFLTVKTANATHFAAADIYYEHVQGLEYKVHLVLYRDCKATGTATLGPQENIDISSVSCGYNSNLTVLHDGLIDTLSSLCENVSNWCKDVNSIYPAYERRHYEANVVLPQACTDYIFTWSVCCRNNAINNLTTPGGQSLCVQAGLNNVARPINSSPLLTSPPIPYVCVNQLNQYLNGPLDPDLDSLIFTNIQPKGAGTCGVIGYAGGNSLINPLPVTPLGAAGYVVDVTTGTVTYTPTTQGVYVLAFQATDYDKNTGAQVGWSQRDVQLNVLNCNAPPPTIVNLATNPIANLCPGVVQSSTTPVVLNVCPGTQVCFDASATSNTVSNLILTYANNAASCPGSTYTSNPLAGGNPVVGNFTWTPTGADIGDHTLIISFVDSTCSGSQPIVLKSYLVVLIKVLQGVDAGPDLVTCANADSVQLNGTGPYTVTQWNWVDLNGNPAQGLSSNSIPNPMAFPGSTTTYILNTNAQTACKNSDTVLVTILPGINVSAGPDAMICANDSTQLNPSISQAQTNPTITWTPNLDLSNNTILQPWASPLVDVTYTLTFVDDNGCKYTDEVLVDVNGARPVVNAISSETFICPNYPFQLFSNAASMPCGLSFFNCTGPIQTKTIGTGLVQQTQYSPYFTSPSWLDNAYKIQMVFTADELQQQGIRAGNINSVGWNVISKGSDTMRNVRISMGCTNLTQFDANVGFAGGLSLVLDTTKYYSSLGWNTHNLENKYFWDGVSNLIVEVCYGYTGFMNSADVIQSTTLMSNQTLFQAGTNPTGCALSGIGGLLSQVRPNTRFRVCETGDFNYTWTPGGSLDNANGRDPLSSGISTTTDFTVTVVSPSNPNCVATDVVQVQVDNSNMVDAISTPMVICEPGLVTLSATPAGPLPVYECGEENVNCISPIVQYAIGAGLTSSTALTPFCNSGAGGRTQMLFTPADLAVMGLTKGKIHSIAFDVFNKTSVGGHNMSIKMGCTPLTQFPAGSNFLPETMLKTVYTNSNYATVPGLNTFNLPTPFVWDGVSSLLVEVCFFNGANNVIGSGDAVNYEIVPNVQFLSQTSNIAGCEILSTPTIQSLIRPNIVLNVCDIPVKTWPYKWEPGTFVFDSTAGVTTAYINQTTTFTVTTKGGNKCNVSDDVTVILSVHDLYVTPKDTFVCEGDSFTGFAFGSGNAPSSSYVWYDKFGGSVGLSCTNCNTPIITPPSTAYDMYYCVRTDSYGCSDTDYIHISIWPKPIVNILNGDSIKIKYQQEVNLIATGAHVYNWTPVWGTSNPNTYHTVVSPAEPTMYYVIGLNEQGCRNMDSIYVDVDYHDNLFVPNAFSPNGDGKNDVFRIANLTFQNVQEFRVLNRWGQEVFNATDNKGWDGRFKGKPQDPATFYYLIRVADPDGKVRTFKGDVILIR